MLMSGHKMAQRGKRWICELCTGSPGKHYLKEWLVANSCPGTVRQHAQQDRPVRVAPNQVPIGTRQIHASHRTSTMHGLVWCWRCAHVGVQLPGKARMVKLATKCVGHATPSGTTVLNRLRQGLPPKAGQTWPDGTSGGYLRRSLPPKRRRKRIL